MKTKVPPAVAAAKAVLAEKTAELDAAQEVVRRIASERSEAFKAIRKAQEDADESLPQCKIVTLSYGRVRDGQVRAVILRKTPSGMLVVRHFGGEHEYKFQPGKDDGVFRETGYRSFSNCRELRDVPAEYMPK